MTNVIQSYCNRALHNSLTIYSVSGWRPAQHHTQGLCAAEDSHEQQQRRESDCKAAGRQLNQLASCKHHSVNSTDELVE